MEILHLGDDNDVFDDMCFLRMDFVHNFSMSPTGQYGHLRYASILCRILRQDHMDKSPYRPLQPSSPGYAGPEEEDSPAWSAFVLSQRDDARSFYFQGGA